MSEEGLDNMTVLIIEDESPIAEAVAYTLRQEGYQVLLAEDGERGLSMARTEKPDVIVLDLMLPHLSGLDVCRAIRKESDVPIIMLTAKASETDKVVGMEIGADDYMTKPFSTRELIARIKAVLRRSSGRLKIKGAINFGDLEIDENKQTVFRSGEPINLSRREFALLAFFATNPDQVFTREAILDRVWGPEAFVEPHTVDVHVRWLRTKIEKDPSLPRHILTVRGVGYRFSGAMN